MEFKRLSLAERNRRWKALKEAMAKENLDVVILQAAGSVWESTVRYIADTNWLHFVHHVIFPLEGDPIILLHGKDWIKTHTGWVNNYELLDGTSDQVSRIAKRFHKGNKVGYIVGSMQKIADFPLDHALYAQLKTAFGDSLVNADQIYKDIRIVHSPEELECLKLASDISDKAFRYVVDNCLREGVLDFDICAEVSKIYFENGNDGLQMLWLAADNDGIGYGRPYGKILSKGSTLMIEFAPGYNGYFSEIVFSLPVDDRLSDNVKDKYKIWQEAFYVGKDKIKPGNRACDVAIAIEDIYKKYGIGFRPDYGHGLGMACCCGYGISNFDTTELKENMSIVLHPKVTDAEGRGVFSGMHYIITDSGVERLGGYNYEEFLDKMIAKF
jgi:Xaa-Pro aminopeptidase